MHRIRSWARQHATERSVNKGGNTGSVLPVATRDVNTPGVNNNTASTAIHDTEKRDAGNLQPAITGQPELTSVGIGSSTDAHDHVATGMSTTSFPTAPLPVKSETAGETDSTIRRKEPKPPITTRMKAGCKRFGNHTWKALTHSWVNVLLICVPAGIAVEAAGVNPSVVFALNAVAIIPLAGLLAYATENVAARLGDTLGALLNVSFGNAVELIIFIIALVKNEIRIVQASLVGSILSNLLLILGMAFLLGGLRFQEQIYNSTVTQMSACLLSLSVISLVLPTAFHASFSDSTDADNKVLKVSRGTSIILLLIYILYLLFQLKSHAYLYESTPQRIIDEESHPGILHDLMDSSTSSSDSDSSSSSDSDTSGSHTTTKRIKRAFRNRRRRKSSTSSINTSSVISSPSVERAGPQWESQLVPAQSSRRPSALGAIVSGDEADTDGEGHLRNSAEPRVRDFVQRLQLHQEVVREETERKHKRKSKKKHHKHSRKEENIAETQERTSIRDGKRPEETSNSPKVEFSDDVQVQTLQQNPSQPLKKPFGGLSRQAFRPALPKMLSQNVFVSPPPVVSTPPATVAFVAPGLRRTSSLPDRLNRRNTPSGSTRQENLPPYPRGPPARAESGLSEKYDDDDEKPSMSRTAACVLLLITTALVAVCAEFMVDAIPAMVDNTSVSQAFIGLIILPIVSNAAEHVTAVTVAAKNKMDLAIGVSVGSSIQIALLVTPLVVLLGWILDKDMSLYFTLFETVSLFVTAFVVNFLVLDGRSNYLEGSLLIAGYVIIAICAFYYPDGTDASSLGGAGTA